MEALLEGDLRWRSGHKSETLAPGCAVSPFKTIFKSQCPPLAPSVSLRNQTEGLHHGVFAMCAILGPISGNCSWTESQFKIPTPLGLPGVKTCLWGTQNNAKLSEPGCPAASICSPTEFKRWMRAVGAVRWERRGVGTEAKSAHNTPIHCGVGKNQICQEPVYSCFPVAAPGTEGSYKVTHTWCSTPNSRQRNELFRSVTQLTLVPL